MDVAVNTGENGKPVWIIIRDYVYDVTDYLDNVSESLRKLLQKNV